MKNKTLVIAVIGIIVIVIGYFAIKIFFTPRVIETIPPVSTSIPISQWLTYTSQTPQFSIQYPNDWQYQAKPISDPNTLLHVTFSPQDTKVSRQNQVIVTLYKNENTGNIDDWIKNLITDAFKSISISNYSLTNQTIGQNNVKYLSANLPVSLGKLECYFLVKDRYIISLMSIGGYAPGIKEKMIQTIVP